jgi:hypothetical protein
MVVEIKVASGEGNGDETTVRVKGDVVHIDISLVQAQIPKTEIGALVQKRKPIPPEEFETLAVLTLYDLEGEFSNLVQITASDEAKKGQSMDPYNAGTNLHEVDISPLDVLKAMFGTEALTDLKSNPAVALQVQQSILITLNEYFPEEARIDIDEFEGI